MGQIVSAPPGDSFDTTPVTNAMSPYAVLATDVYLLVDTSAGAVTITLPAPATFAPSGARTLGIKDAVGNFTTNPCNLDHAAGGNIDGSAVNPRALQANFGAWSVICDGINFFLGGG